ncbi:hypothetical protein GCM10010038_07480 [Glutamicibacter protophormiae]|nr:hypothetical protein GCM10010038_07480 [Glutamicibacter protophormiae]
MLLGQVALDFDSQQAPVAMCDIPNEIMHELTSETHSVGWLLSTPANADTKVLVSPATDLWDVIEAAYGRLKFSILDGPTVKAIVQAQLINWTSKADTNRILNRIRSPYPSLGTPLRSLHTRTE